MSRFERWAVVRVATGEPVEGCVYSDHRKAVRRLRGMADPVLFRVAKVLLMVVPDMP